MAKKHMKYRKKLGELLNWKEKEINKISNKEQDELFKNDKIYDRKKRKKVKNKYFQKKKKINKKFKSKKNRLKKKLGIEF